MCDDDSIEMKLNQIYVINEMCSPSERWCNNDNGARLNFLHLILIIRNVRTFLFDVMAIVNWKFVISFHNGKKWTAI